MQFRQCLEDQFIAVKLIVIAVAFWVMLQFYALFVGNNIVAERSHRMVEASLMSRAFLEYSLSHKGPFPKFRNGIEVTQILQSEFERQVADRHSPSLAQLEDACRRSVWNPALSGSPADGWTRWVFYLRGIDDEYFVGFRTRHFETRSGPLNLL